MLRSLFWRVYGLARTCLRLLGTLIAACVLMVGARLSRRRRNGQRLWWGPEPLVHLKYLSDALRDAGYQSATVVTHNYPEFDAIKFDTYYEDVIAASPLRFLRSWAGDYIVFLHLLKNFDVAHIPATGGPLGRTRLAPMEPRLFRWAGIRTVLVPYGGDFFRYSWIAEALMRHAMLLNYPDAGRQEDRVEKRVKRWLKHADIVVGGFMIEGASRWDVLATNFLILTPDRVRPRQRPQTGDGASESVTIVHAPNHRGVKGTEFIIEAVTSLKGKGHDIDFVLLEDCPNEKVLEHLGRADICVDHCVGSGYGLFAVEAMASGATVVANLEDEQRIGVHRHFGWLNQCPIVSANIDQLEETLAYLIRNPALREELGRTGVEYVKRFHSPEMAQHLFGSVYAKLRGEDVDLLMLFHPVTSEFMRRFEPLTPPLQRSRPKALL
jgi:glycosyltransferase involved in cell wall biosynthesis